jgi:hypothetical protein
MKKLLLGIMNAEDEMTALKNEKRCASFQLGNRRETETAPLWQ